MKPAEPCSRCGEQILEHDELTERQDDENRSRNSDERYQHNWLQRLRLKVNGHCTTCLTGQPPTLAGSKWAEPRASLAVFTKA